MKCPKCGDEMLPYEVRLVTNERFIYWHKCPNCGHEEKVRT